MQDEHTWVRERLLARALGFLEPEFAARVDAHVAGCAGCAGELEQMVGGGVDGDEALDAAIARGHLPAAMIARWPQALSSLVGLERKAVAHHLAHCKSCRHELELLGHDAARAVRALMPVTTAEDKAPAPATDTPPREDALRAVAPMPRARRGGSWSWNSWVFGLGIGAVAMVAAFMVFVVPNLPSGGPASRPAPGTVPRVSQGPGSGDGAGADASALSALRWVAPAALRGDENTAALPPGSHQVALALSVAGSDAALVHRVEVFGPDGALVARTEVTAAAVQSGTAFIVLRTAQELRSGSYRVVLRPMTGATSENGATEAATTDSVESFFSLRVGS